MRDKGRIVLKTSKGDDQYGRYLADVWICSVRSNRAAADGTRTPGDACEDKNIDQELLASGLFAVRGQD
jgi:endonuclease YncB( thermonuclease family)